MAHREGKGPSVRPLVVARAFSAGITLLIPVVLARALSVSDYGTFKQFFLVSATLYLVLGLGVPQSLYYFLPRAGASERRALLFHTLAFLALFGAIGGASILLAEPALVALGGARLAQVALPLGLYLFFFLGAGAFEPGLTAQGRPGAAALSYVVSDTFRASAFILPVAAGLGLEGSLWGAVAFSSLRLAACWLVLLRGSEGPLFRPALFRAQLRYALPYGGAMLVAMPQQQLHQYAVSLTSSPAAFAIYSVGCFNLPLVDLLYTPTTEILMYRLGEMERRGRGRDEAIAAFRDAVAKLGLAFFPLALGIFAIAPSFLSLLYGAEYVESAPILRVALGMVVLSIFPVDGVLRAKAKTRLLFFSYLGKIALSLPLVFGFLRWMGPIGAMVGFICTEAIHKSILLVFAARALNEGPGGLGAVLPARSIATAAAAGGLALLLVAGARASLPMEPLAAVFFHGGIFGLAYLGGLRAGGVRVASLWALLVPRASASKH